MTLSKKEENDQRTINSKKVLLGRERLIKRMIVANSVFDTCFSLHIMEAALYTMDYGCIAGGRL